MAVDRVVVIGASAGGVEPMRQLIADLPPDLPAAVLIVVHIPTATESALPKLLDRLGPLPARHPREGEELQGGVVLVAPPDRHLVVRDGRVHLSSGPRENRQRPAVDPLFRSAALAYGPGVVAVVLSGALDDGSVGAAIVAAQDGTVVVQDPAEARVSGMPRAALTAVRRARAAPAAALATLVVDALGASAGQPPPTPEEEEKGRPAMAGGPTEVTANGVPAALGCPECQGGMFESAAQETVSYRCHVGHSWSAHSLLEAEREAVEGAIYNASSKLLEMAAVHRRLAELRGDGAGREEHLRAAAAAEDRARRIEELATEDPRPA